MFAPFKGEASQFNEEWEKKTQPFNRDYTSERTKRSFDHPHSRHTLADTTHRPRDRTHLHDHLALTDGPQEDRKHVQFQHQPADVHSTKTQRHHRPKTPAQIGELHVSGRGVHLPQEKKAEAEKLPARRHARYPKTDR